MRTDTDLEVIRERDRLRLTKLSRVQWWRLERQGDAPRRLQLGKNSVGWLKAEVEAWIAGKVAARKS